MYGLTARSNFLQWIATHDSFPAIAWIDTTTTFQPLLCHFEKTKKAACLISFLPIHCLIWHFHPWLSVSSPWFPPPVLGASECGIVRMCRVNSCFSVCCRHIRHNMHAIVSLCILIEQTRRPSGPLQSYTHVVGGLKPPHALRIPSGA